MAEEIITREELVDAKVDAKDLGECVNGNETGIVNPRYGDPYPTLPMAIQKVMETGGFEPFLTEVQLLASTPSISPKAAKAMDTKKIWYWGKYSETETVDSWHDTGLSELDQAEALMDLRVARESGTDIAQLKDVNGKTVFTIKKDGKFYFVGLKGDLITVVNKLSSMLDTGNTTNLIEAYDINGKPTLVQNKRGDLILPNIGNLTRALNTIKGDVAAQSTINLPAAHLSGKYNDFLLTEEMPDFTYTDILLTASYIESLGIFPHSVTMVRIPAITRIEKTKYLLFFEARETVDDLGKNSQGVATIDVDEITGIATVSDVKVLHAAFTDDSGKLRTFMNACAVKLDSGRIICLYVRRYKTLEHELYKRYSDDNGATWSEYEDITSVKGSTNWNLLCPCSQGLVKRYGKHKGRIVFPLWTSGTAYTTTAFRAGYIYSDDNGGTWHLGEFAEYSTANEVQCAEDLNGDLLFSIRVANDVQPKVLAILSDEKKTYKTVQPNKQLTAAQIMSGLIQGENKYDRTANKFQLTACRNLNRTELVIHTSYDGGENWLTHLLPETINSPVMYTCIENVSARKKFLVWESDGHSNIKYAVVGLSNLINEVS